MANLSVFNLADITKGFRAFLQGRVLLRANANAGATTLTVGVSSTGLHDAGTPGTCMFFAKSTACTVVQPNAAGTGVEHSEAVTLSTVGNHDINLTITSALTKSYTTARHAYVKITTMPSPISDLEIVQQDILFSQDPTKERLPSCLVTLENVDVEPAGSSQYHFELTWRIKYCRKRTEGEDPSEAFYNDIDVLANQVLEDPYLGGWVDNSQVSKIVHIPQDQREKELAMLLPYDWGYMWVWAEVDRNYVKFIA